jgi:UDP-GlcNAc:undecaprenyl-phosphate GlcNAc-1-phosphate transferase
MRGFWAYLVVFAVAGVVTYVSTPAVLALSRRIGAVDIPDDRKVHAVPTPTLGGTGMFLGFMAALVVASSLEEFQASFRPLTVWPPTEMIGISVGVTVIYALGVFDDLKGMQAPVKLSAQFLAAGLVFLAGVRLRYFRFPLLEALSLDPELQAITTILWIVLIVNAVNLIDGLDGLAAGITAIAAGTFFIYSYNLSRQGLAGPEPSAPLISIAIVGVTLGFLRYNFNPAKIFMGDSGSMSLGFLLAAATVVGVGRSAPQNPNAESELFLFYLPLVIPVILLAVPLLDAVMALIRRARKRRHLFRADKEHIHHRLLEIGHGHRQAVLIMYVWTAAVAAATLALSFLPRPYAFLFVAATLGLILYTAVPRVVRWRRTYTL